MPQTTEAELRKTLLRLNDVWFIKLQNAHFTKTPFDFLVITPSLRVAIECKEVKSHLFPFSNFPEHQRQSLKTFKDKHPGLNRAYVLIRFKTFRNKTNTSFLIDIDKYMTLEQTLAVEGRRSFSKDYLLSLLKPLEDSKKRWDLTVYS